MDDYSTTPPFDVRGFQRQLDAATRDHHLNLRIAWGPALTSMRVLDRTFAKYPDPACTEWAETLKGYRIVNGNQVVGYESLAGIITGSPEGLRTPHYDRRQYGLPFFVIEQEMHRDAARIAHATLRQKVWQRLGKDYIGEFPREGFWTWFMDISEHRDGCCERPYCRGVAREPNDVDLDYVKEALAIRQRMPQLRNPADPPSAREIFQAASQMSQAIDDYDRRAYDDLTRELGENIAACLRPHMTPSVYVDLRAMKEGTANGS